METDVAFNQWQIIDWDMQRSHAPRTDIDCTAAFFSRSASGADFNYLLHSAHPLRFEVPWAKYSDRKYENRSRLMTFMCTCIGNGAIYFDRPVG